MKQIIIYTTLLCASLLVGAQAELEFELTSHEYENLLKERGLEPAQKHALSPVMAMGKRSLDWLSYINQFREPNNKISFSSVENQPAYPLESPRVSNPTLILEEFEKIKAEMPKWYYAVLFENAAFSKNPPASDEEYKSWGIKIDLNYVRAARWLLQEDSLSSYAAKRRKDLRGYYFLGKVSDLKKQLDNWNSHEVSTQKQYEEWLVGLCYVNGVSESTCLSDLKKLYPTPGKIYGYYTKYLPKAKTLWNSFFFLAAERRDISWDKPEVATIPFIDPKNNAVVDYLQKNIEDEWKWNGWNLKLNFVNGNPNTTAHIVFSPGATPNVNGLAGNQITMDKNKPLTEYDVQWTIRHEFGHVLGFPDCYIEFYDDRSKVMISYQLDITDLMCSRRGKLKENHYQEMNKHYFNNF